MKIRNTGNTRFANLHLNAKSIKTAFKNVMNVNITNLSEHLQGIRKVPLLAHVDKDNGQWNALMAALNGFGISQLYVSLKAMHLFEDIEKIDRLASKIKDASKLHVSVVHKISSVEKYKLSVFGKALEDAFCKAGSKSTKILVASEVVMKEGKKVEERSLFVLSGAEDLELYKAFTSSSASALENKYSKGTIVCPTPGSIQMFSQGLGHHISLGRAKKIMDHWNNCHNCQEAYKDVPKIFAEKFKNPDQ